MVVVVRSDSMTRAINDVKAVGKHSPDGVQIHIGTIVSKPGAVCFEAESVGIAFPGSSVEVNIHVLIIHGSANNPATIHLLEGMIEAELIRNGIAFKIAKSGIRFIGFITSAKPNAIIAIRITGIAQTLVKAIHFDGGPIVASCSRKNSQARIRERGIRAFLQLTRNVPICSFITKNVIDVIVAGFVVPGTCSSSVVLGVFGSFRFIIGFLGDDKRDVLEAFVQHLSLELGAVVRIDGTAGRCKTNADQVIEAGRCAHGAVQFDIDRIARISRQCASDKKHVPVRTGGIKCHIERTVAR